MDTSYHNKMIAVLPRDPWCCGLKSRCRGGYLFDETQLSPVQRKPRIQYNLKMCPKCWHNKDKLEDAEIIATGRGLIADEPKDQTYDADDEKSESESDVKEDADDSGESSCTEDGSVASSCTLAGEEMLPAPLREAGSSSVKREKASEAATSEASSCTLEGEEVQRGTTSEASSCTREGEDDESETMSDATMQ